jgi:hypothetical protein
VAPKFDPKMLTAVPETPELGEIAEMTGVTVKTSPFVEAPFTTTVNSPVNAPVGTGATSVVLLHEVGVLGTPLKRTMLVPWLVPKFEPLIVTAVPTVPETGKKFEIAGETVKITWLLLYPPTVTITGPFVAPVGTGTTTELFAQLTGDVLIPLNVTVLEP